MMKGTFELSKVFSGRLIRIPLFRIALPKIILPIAKYTISFVCKNVLRISSARLSSGTIKEDGDFRERSQAILSAHNTKVLLSHQPRRYCVPFGGFFATRKFSLPAMLAESTFRNPSISSTQFPLFSFLDISLFKNGANIEKHDQLDAADPQFSKRGNFRDKYSKCLNYKTGIYTMGGGIVAFLVIAKCWHKPTITVKKSTEIFSSEEKHETTESQSSKKEKKEEGISETGITGNAPSSTIECGKQKAEALPVIEEYHSLIDQNLKVNRTYGVVSLTIIENASEYTYQNYYQSLASYLYPYHAVIVLEYSLGGVRYIERFDLITTRDGSKVRQKDVTDTDAISSKEQLETYFRVNLHYRISWPLRTDILFNRLRGDLTAQSHNAIVPPIFDRRGSYVTTKEDDRIQTADGKSCWRQNHNCISWAQSEIVFFGEGEGKIKKEEVCHRATLDRIAILPTSHIPYMP